MSNVQNRLRGAALLTIFSGAALLARPAAAASPAFVCGTAAATYVKKVVADVCGSGGGTGYYHCDGATVVIDGVSCT
jgi:hypothetical protein